ncbi:TadE family type IV pilus minor pilin [Mycolicibacterium sp. XJ1819]
MAALVVVLLWCLAGLTAVSTQVRCIDAAREAARLAARGKEGAAAVRAIAPEGAAVQVRRDGDFVVVIVTADAPLLPWVSLAARSAAMVEVGVP